MRVNTPELTAEVVGAGEFGERTLRFGAVEDFYGVVGRIGHMPLPPYIRREQAREMDTAEDRERYQTVYSQAGGVGGGAYGGAALYAGGAGGAGGARGRDCVL